MLERIWHPVSRLEFFIDHTRRWAVDVREHLETLEEARTKPYVLASTGSGCSPGRSRRTYGAPTRRSTGSRRHCGSG
ncbi:hypothetical protein ABB07_39250 (plasmid) [Streptomyces incarnatus]|uniref:Uncharacterized protein n=1 Tax=Streptomyces incarnatus TaxID=665007 RepID=A0ABN4GPW7_9ACTN|nr:hypothetical protein ABB07_39250 [Streptomyces incarnatus]